MAREPSAISTERKNTIVDGGKTGIDGVTKQGKDGVTVSANQNKAGGYPGRFQPGVSGNPAGRPKRVQEEAVLHALSNHYPPERLIAIIDKALEIAEETKSARGMMKVVETVFDRLWGRPSVRIEGESDSLDIFLARLRSSRSE